MNEPRYPRGLLIDVAGTLQIEGRIDQALIHAFELLRAADVPFRLVTNVTRKSHKALLEQLLGEGLSIDAEELFTVSSAAKAYLAENNLHPYLLVHPALLSQFRSFFTPQPDSVLVGDAGQAFTYGSLSAAFRILLDGGPLIAMGDNRYFHDGQKYMLDQGPFVRALEYAAGVEALVIGKPAPEFFLSAVSDMKLDAADCLMIGDDARSDVAAARRAGLQGVLVQTGKYRAGDENLDGDTLPTAATLLDVLRDFLSR